MYQKPTSIDTASKLPINQDAWLFYRFDQLEVIRLHLAPGSAGDQNITKR